jgi:hypothetical protein
MFVPRQTDDDQAEGAMIPLADAAANDERWQDRAWSALQTGLTVWGAYVLFVQLMRRLRR